VTARTHAEQRRVLINLKPKAQRGDISAVIRRLQASFAKVEGIALYMQPVQDLTIEDRGQPHPVPVHARDGQPTSSPIGFTGSPRG